MTPDPASADQSGPEKNATPGQLSLRTKLLFGLVGLGLAAGALWIAFPAAPDDEALRAFVRQDLERDGLRLRHSVVENRTDERGSVSAAVRVAAERPAHKGYTPVTPQVIVSPPPFDVAQWQRVTELLNGAAGPQLFALAHLDPEAAALARITVLNEMDVDREPLNIRAFVRADRLGFRWMFSLTTKPYRSRLQATSLKPLTAFSGETRVLGRASDQERLAGLARRLPEILAALERAWTQFFAQKTPAALALLRPGTRFVGKIATATHPTDAPRRVLLEITELRANETPPEFSAIMRNDGGGNERRIFAGRLEPIVATGGVLLRLTAPRNLPRFDVGPLLQDRFEGIELDDHPDGVQLRLAIDGTTLVSQGHRFTVRFERVATDAANSAANAGFGDRAAALAKAIVPGALYTGTVTNRASGKAERYALRFIADGEKTVALFEHPERTDWRCRFALLLEANRYETSNGTKPVQLLRTPNPGSDEPPDEMLRTFDSEMPPIPLDIESDRLVGETPNFVYRFSRATPDLATTDAKLRTLQEATLRAFIAPGAIHAGTVERAGTGSSAQVRLRFVTVAGSVEQSYRLEFRDNVPPPTGVERLYAILYAAEEPRFATPLTGAWHVQEGQIEFQLEKPPEWPGGAFNQASSVRASLGDIWLYPESLHLRLDGNVVVGAITRDEGDVRFRFTPASAADNKRWQDEADRRAAQLRDILRPGVVLAGTLALHNVRPAAQVRLRIEQLDESRRMIRAILESAPRPALRANLSGHFDRSYCAVKLTLEETPNWPDVESADDDPTLRRQWDGHLGTGTELGFYIDSDRLVGHNNDLPDEMVRLEFPLPTKEQR